MNWSALFIVVYCPFWWLFICKCPTSAPWQSHNVEAIKRQVWLREICAKINPCKHSDYDLWTRHRNPISSSRCLRSAVIVLFNLRWWLTHRPSLYSPSTCLRGTRQWPSRALNFSSAASVIPTTLHDQYLPPIRGVSIRVMSFDFRVSGQDLKAVNCAR